MTKKKNAEEISIITSEIVDEVIKLLKDDVYKIILYGSYARGDFNLESDMDIMIILNCDKDTVTRYRKQISKLASRMCLKNDIEISLLLRDRATFEEREAILPFYKNIRNEGVALYEKCSCEFINSTDYGITTCSKIPVRCAMVTP